jgi:hypothetical protein
LLLVRVVRVVDVIFVVVDEICVLRLRVGVVAAELLGEKLGEGAIDGVFVVGAEVGEDAVGDGGGVGGEFGL